jgi:hemolysin activation/secretion protein
VRGYRAYLMSSDDALNLQSELRYSAFRLALPGIARAEGDGVVQLVPFLDWAVAWNVHQPPPIFPNLLSGGAGLRWALGSGAVAEIYYGHGVRRANLGNSLGDQGIQFRFSLKV